MINLLRANVDPALLARYLLTLAKIPPCPNAEEDDQYEITGFGIDVDGIYITNRGKCHHLTTRIKRHLP